MFCATLITATALVWTYGWDLRVTYVVLIALWFISDYSLAVYSLRVR